MDVCKPYRALTTPFVDGELSPRVRAGFEAHLGRCPHCQAAVATERAVRTLAARRDRLRDKAPASLSRSVASRGRAGARLLWRRFGAPVPVAATLVLALAAALAYGLFGQGGRAFAAQIALDHVKCTRIVARQPASSDVTTEVAGWESRYGWRPAVPAPAAGSTFAFVALRRCLHSRGMMAHALYRRGDRLLSLFVLPRDAQSQGLQEIMGQRASFWSAGTHTYAIVGAAEPAELDEFRRFASRAAN